MRADRALLLAGLLREMRELDRGYFPDEAWLEIHKAFAIPYVEVVIPRLASTPGPEFFLLRREAADPYWPDRPWHIPGGIWRVSDSLADACQAVALREPGVGVVNPREVMTYKWPDHPYANAISHVCVCEPVTLPIETDVAKFWSMAELPKPLLMHHAEFLETCCRHLVSGKDN